MSKTRPPHKCMRSVILVPLSDLIHLCGGRVLLMYPRPPAPSRSSHHPLADPVHTDYSVRLTSYIGGTSLRQLVLKSVRLHWNPHAFHAWRSPTNSRNRTPCREGHFPTLGGQLSSAGFTIAQNCSARKSPSHQQL